MKARRYDEVLRARGYKVIKHNEYQGTDIYEKKHLFNTIYCSVVKDTHGKAQEMNFMITGGNKIPSDFEDFKRASLDHEFLAREAVKIHDCFEQLKQMKSPKHLYCF